jgi:hypothetical protein
MVDMWAHHRLHLLCTPGFDCLTLETGEARVVGRVLAGGHSPTLVFCPHAQDWAHV